MKKQMKSHRFIATFFLLIFFPTLVPTNLFASNNGPVSPEAASFEPVDAADMVNLLTGDMSYVLPLLNVPSPEGGYPLALSNHAGIAIDQEASWVGLGWSLNPGAINRAVTGVPDDWKRSDINQIVYDAGGVSTSYSGSISVGWGKGMYSVGLYGSYTENKTFGGSTSYSTDGGVQGSLGMFSSSLGTDGVSFGVQGQNKAGSMGGSLTVNQSFKNGSTSISAGIQGSRGESKVGGPSSIGLSLSSKYGLSGSVMGQGFKIAGNNMSAGKLNVSTQSYNVSVQIYAVNIGLGFSKARYWSYENNFTKYDGSLYAGDISSAMSSTVFPKTVAFDSYNSIYKMKSDEQLDGSTLSYVAYDYYSVSGQGMSGSFKPAIFQQGSLIHNFKDRSINNSIVSYRNGLNSTFTKSVDNSLNDIHFYFDNEPSSFLKVSSSDWNINPPSNVPVQQIPSVSPPLGTTTLVDGVSYNGYNSATKRKRTGSFIETFTNTEIINGAQIIKPENFNRTNAPGTGIGAFRITALDGKTYHYSLPVYQKQQFTRSTDLTSEFQNRFYEQQQLTPYATHWLLTAVTGPDYVDNNLNNYVDQGDYGYWTSFDYGKWSDGYTWSTPIKSNEKSKTYEWGVKEVYYLDKIKTRTHTALFVKEQRQDDLSYSLQVGSGPNNLDWKNDVSRVFAEGTNGLLYFSGIYDNPNLNVQNIDPYDILESKYGQYIKCNQHKSLKLNKILLLKNEDATAVNKIGTNSPVSTFNGRIKFVQDFKVWRVNGQYMGGAISTPIDVSWNGEFYNNILDVTDVTAALQQKAIKTVKFDYKTSDLLAKSSPNSSAPGAGRLTLAGVNFIGKDNIQVIPPYKFGYVNTANYSGTMEDNWGFYKNKPDQWSLNKVTSPTGSNMNIIYEGDDIDYEAVPGVRGFDSGLQFVYSNVNNKLRITVNNEFGTSAINFSDHFQIGLATLDNWTAYRHEYWQGGCEARKANIDINTSVNVISVTSSTLVLETTLDHCYWSNGGLDWLFGKICGLNNHPGMIRENFGRNVEPNPVGCDNTDRLVLLYSLMGNKGTSTNDKNGGGIRVKEINVAEGSTKKNIMRYFYNMPGYGENKTDFNYKSSGSTSYVPQKYFKEIKFRSELPSPAVMYEFVTVRNYSTTNLPGESEQYQFEVLKPDAAWISSELNLPNALEIQQIQMGAALGASSEGENYNIHFSRFRIKDMTASLGRLKQKKSFNNLGHLMSEVKYNFKNVENINQGISEESFNTYKRVKNDYLNYKLSVTSKIKYPSILDNVSTTQGGYSNNVYYEKYDFLTGQLVESKAVASDGTSYRGKVIPAYEKYSAMGAKADNVSNKNMLSQTAGDYSYILDAATGTWKETGVGITTWNNQWTYKGVGGDTESTNVPVWRIHKTYLWDGIVDSNGLFQNYNSSTDGGFVWGVGTQPLQWKQISEVTLYNHYSAELESKDLNNNLRTLKMGDNDTKAVAGGNAGYNELFFSSAENIKDNFWLDSEVRLESGARNLSYAHTGKYSIAATSSSKFGVVLRAGQHRPGKYRVSVWAHKMNADKARLRLWDNSATTTLVPVLNEKVTAGDWVLLNFYVDIPVQERFIYVNSIDGTTVYFDDLMIRPISSTVTGYVYNQYDELTSVVANTGMASKYEYDAEGRLIRTYVEVVDGNGIVSGGFKLKTENKIKYKNF